MARETASIFVRIVGWVGQILRGRAQDGKRPVARGRIQAPATLVARIARVAGRDREMLRLADEAIRRGHPEQAVIACWKAARSFIKEGHVLKAVAVLNRILRYENRDVDAWLELAMCYETLERRREAANACLHAAELLELRGDDADAMLMLEKSLDLDPGRAEAEARLIPLRMRLGVSRVVPHPSSSPSAARFGTLDPEAGPRLNTEPDGDVKGELGHASSMQAFRADDDSGSIDLPDLHTPEFRAERARSRIREERSLLVPSDTSDPTDPAGEAVDLAAAEEALATDATLPMRLPMETEDPTVMNLPVPDVIAARSRGRAVPAVSSIAADATVAERIPGSLLGVPGVAATTIEPIPQRPRILDAATTVDARALPASIRGSEHEGRARREAAIRATDAATRAYPRVESVEPGAGPDEWDLGLAD
ncbi:MAG: tetratricopeptide repeat protein [Deltaproteobacteria bacterium]|nr:tetratricopeptide repeat protein [Deltaproteobacteria bacterium]